MSVVALTGRQAQAVDALVRAGRLQRVDPDLDKAERFMAQAAEGLAELVHVRASHVRYDIGYNAAHDVGEAVLAAYGFRTASGPGQHVALGSFLEAVFDTPPPSDAARQFERMRTARNNLRYQARPTGAALSERAVRAAAVLIDAARERIQQ